MCQSQGVIHPHFFVKVGAVLGVKVTFIRLNLGVFRLKPRGLVAAGPTDNHRHRPTKFW